MNMFITEYQGVNQSTTVLPCFYHTNTVIPCFLYSTLVYHVNIIVFEHGIHLVPWYLSNYHSFTIFFFTMVPLSVERMLSHVGCRFCILNCFSFLFHLLLHLSYYLVFLTSFNDSDLMVWSLSVRVV